SPIPGPGDRLAPVPWEPYIEPVGGMGGDTDDDVCQPGRQIDVVAKKALSVNVSIDLAGFIFYVKVEFRQNII
ncbi:MAG: hypothetical protein ACOVVK_00210, partial [Elsteraceae bacterium]